MVRTIDANGEIESEAPVGMMDYGDPYRVAGEISFTNELVEFSGVELFPRFLVALMKHSVELLVLGYGETPGDVVEGFNRLDFLAASEYEFVGDGVEPFVGLNGNIAVVREGEDCVVEVKVNNDSFDHVIEGNEQIVAFLCSTIPVG